MPSFKPDDDALILYTSGTTGEPKGVVLSYRNLLQYPKVMREMGVTDAATMRGCVLPMSHIVGPVVCNELAEKGYTLVIFDQINPVTLLEGIQKYRVNVFESVPIVFQLLLGVKNLASYDTSSMKIAAMMGTSIPMPLLRAFQAAQPHIKVIQGYGLTETSPMITLVDPDKAEAKMGSIGRAVPGVEVRIVDENDKEVPVGEAGEIITRGPHVMKGYFRRADATAQRIRNGWLYTGDVGKVEADGYYYHLGRRDDMIITGGLNVYPAEVENMIYTYPGVQETIVFAIPEAKRGQVIGAAIVPRPGATVVEKELLTFLRANLANFKVPDQHRHPRIAAAHLVGENDPRRRDAAGELRSDFTTKDTKSTKVGILAAKNAKKKSDYLPQRRKDAKREIMSFRPKGEIFVRSLALARDDGLCPSLSVFALLRLCSGHALREKSPNPISLSPRR